MKFFDLEFGNYLEKIGKEKGGERDVYFIVHDSYIGGCTGTRFTDGSGNIVSHKNCDVQSEWHVVYKSSGCTAS